uniref:NAD-dependent epimerase/dehydratase domain-containing protein n=1 Tax=Leptocylindrus danicus TaxID=163516 RepID=A0A7S2KT43_9STRA
MRSEQLWKYLLACSIVAPIAVFLIERTTLVKLDQARGSRLNYFIPTPLTGSADLPRSWVNAHRKDKTSRSKSFSDELTSESVVLITGAGGFIGSELAMALYRTFGISNIICIDIISQHVIDLSKLDNIDQDVLAFFEYKRQRLFHLLQTVPSIQFYVDDFRPSIPEFFDVGEVPLLESIFQRFPDITHVVHLADAQQSWSGSSVAVPHVQDEKKTGMIEVLLEQLKKMSEEQNRTPTFTYASSYEVYGRNSNAALKEEDPIYSPSSLHGASKLLDEVLAASYHSLHGIPSTGCRFFPVYGPWSTPGSPVFEMAENALSDHREFIIDYEESRFLRPKPNDKVDFVFISDAIDAILAAMQYRQKDAPAIFNVGTGEPTSLEMIATEMGKYVKKKENNQSTRSVAQSFSASIQNTSQMLGWHPRVSLKEGVLKLLAWHWDRMYPYGAKKSSSPEIKTEESVRTTIAAQGVQSCLPFDKECLRGATIFPCISECANPSMCTTSAYDDEPIKTSNAITEGCTEVLFTIALGLDVLHIPSGNAKEDPNAMPYVRSQSAGVCNIAFVSEGSSILKEASMISKSGKSLTHGFWRLIPIPLDNDKASDALLPKMSPGSFFAHTVKTAIYCEPNILFHHLPSLLEEIHHHPKKEGTTSSTVMVLPRKRQQSLDKRITLQERAYDKVRIAMRGNRFRKQYAADSYWVLHRLDIEDNRLFRCDVYGETLNWSSQRDDVSINFILALHDIWSCVIVNWHGMTQWWHDEGSSVEEEGGRIYRALYTSMTSSESTRYFVRILDASASFASHLPTFRDDEAHGALL